MFQTKMRIKCSRERFYLQIEGQYVCLCVPCNKNRVQTNLIFQPWNTKSSSLVRQNQKKEIYYFFKDFSERPITQILSEITVQVPAWICTYLDLYLTRYVHSQICICRDLQVPNYQPIQFHNYVKPFLTLVSSTYVKKENNEGKNVNKKFILEKWQFCC